MCIDAFRCAEPSIRHNYNVYIVTEVYPYENFYSPSCVKEIPNQLECTVVEYLVGFQCETYSFDG